MKNYISTYMGIEFSPLDPKDEYIMIEDIAHSLSLLCRANGHYTTFYSVGAHCINCFEEAVARRESNRVKMACLLHDATESYISDLTRPVKKFLPEYQDIEDKLSKVIYTRFLGSELSEYEVAMVKTIDDSMLYYEFLEFTGKTLFDEAPYVAATPDFFQGNFKQVEEKFLTIFNSIELAKEEKKETIKWIR